MRLPLVWLLLLVLLLVRVGDDDDDDEDEEEAALGLFVFGVFGVGDEEREFEWPPGCPPCVWML